MRCHKLGENVIILGKKNDRQKYFRENQLKYVLGFWTLVAGVLEIITFWGLRNVFKGVISVFI